MGTSPVDFRKTESLDEIVSHSAAVLAEQIQAAAAWAQSEMDLQVEVVGALKEFAKRAQIKLDGHHNVTVATCNLRSCTFAISLDLHPGCGLRHPSAARYTR